jgi:hypothetical protein
MNRPMPLSCDRDAHLIDVHAHAAGLQARKSANIT